MGLLHGWPLPDICLDDGVQPSAAGKNDATIQAAIHQWEIATCFVLGADKGRFGKLQCDLQDNFARGTNQFPTTLTAAYNLLLTTEATFVAASDTDTHDNDSGSHGRRQRGAHRNNNSNGANNPGNKQADGTPGNKQVNPVNPAGHTGLYTSPCFPQGAILLDTGASTLIIWDQELLTDIVAREPPLTSLTNGGLHSCDYGGIYHGLQQPLPVWYAPDSVGNILALCDVRRLCRVMMDTAAQAAFLVHLPDDTVLCFVEHTNGLYLLSPSTNHSNRIPTPNYSCLTTVVDNHGVFTRQELEGAD